MAKQIGIFLSIVIILLFAGGTYFVLFNQSKSSIVINGQTFMVEVSNTDATRQKGLSGHTPLTANQGMMFVFPQAGNYGFWMKDMTFPIDIVWANVNQQVVHVEENLSPATYPTVFYPNADSMYVLEFSAGTVAKYNIHANDTIQFGSKTF